MADEPENSPFAALHREAPPREPSRERILAAARVAETDCLPPLIAEARLAEPARSEARLLARRLAERLRHKLRHGGSVTSLMQEYGLSSREGVALMCLAEALLRVPDTATRDALIRDKIGPGAWEAHLGHSPSLFVNAATWGLLVTGRLSATSSAGGLSAALTRLLAKGGEPLIRAGVNLAMRLLGEQFVCGRDIAEALDNSREGLKQGYRYSYDMLGEGALTAADATRYADGYARAIAAIAASDTDLQAPVHARPGISVKLSALHPRYVRAQRDRVLAELGPRLAQLARAARAGNIGFNIDAEESFRLDLSLDLLERLCADPALAGWDGLGFVVQAYQKRAPQVIDHLVGLARRSGHRLMVRLVKGAYWDSEIKRAQVDGLPDYPVFTRRAHTDICFLACARRLLAHADAVFPQIATHNALTLASIHAIAGPDFVPGQYEFQCLHGMGEPLYDEVIDPGGLDRPCRIYAPVGSHATLLPYLVRRLLENGANTSFINRVADPDISLDDLLADPVALAEALTPTGAQHPRILAPERLYGRGRRNSTGLDLDDETDLRRLAQGLSAPSDMDGAPAAGRAVRNPADRRDLVGHVRDVAAVEIEAALARAERAAGPWGALAPEARAACLERAADRYQEALPALAGLMVREAGKSYRNAVAELREAVDFLRYYAAEARRLLPAGHGEAAAPLGPVACISPWNFPLAIFTGQVAAALAAGNVVLAKPAEETPLTAQAAVRLLLAGGIPADALQLLPGDGATGAALVADRRICGVLFTGSLEVARLIQGRLAERLGPGGRSVPLVAETGGQNAMVLDSSALPEQAVGDILLSAFDSAGQRCSALRLLCLQEEVAEPVLEMLAGAMAELRLGNPADPATDIGPVIDAGARQRILDRVEVLRAAGMKVTAMPLPPGHERGSFVAPTLVEIGGLADLGDELFGPVLHVLRYRRGGLERLLEGVNALGYGLTFGIHSRIDESVDRLAGAVEVGNVYVNRNMVGAVVGVQPFGGRGLSGTGPKAGGPLYLPRLLAGPTARPPVEAAAGMAEDAAAALSAFRDWLRDAGGGPPLERLERAIARAAPGAELELPGPVGERNLYRLAAKGGVLCLAASEADLLGQIGTCLAGGNSPWLPDGEPATALLARLPSAVAGRIRLVPGAIAELDPATTPAAILFAGSGAELLDLQRRVAALPGPILPIHAGEVPAELLLEEKALSINTAAAGGNAELMSVG